MEDTKKKLRPLGHLEALPLAPLKMVLAPLKVKKNHTDYRVHGIQIDRLELTVSMQKSVLKYMHRVLIYWPKCVKFYWFGLEGRFSTLLW